MKSNSRNIEFLLLICLAVIVNACHIIKSASVPVSQASLYPYLYTKPVWTIEDSAHNILVIGDVSIRHDSIFGQLERNRVVDHPPSHPTEQKTYSRSRGPHSLSYVHLGTKETGLSGAMGIPLSSITSATIHKKAPGASFALTVFGVGVPIVASWALFCNCPYVSAIGADTTVFQGSLFPGAISKSLERLDNLIMKDVPLTSNGDINIRINNALPEIEYFNSIELFEVTEMDYRFLGQHVKGQPVTFNKQDRMLNAVTWGNTSIKESILSYDERFYNFMEQGEEDALNKVFLTFDRAQLGSDAILVLKGKQSKWMESVADFTAQQFGTAFDTWVEKLDKVDPGKYNRNMTDRGISMNAYIRRSNRWEYLGSYANVGSSAYRTLALDVDLNGITEKNIEIKLEAAFGFWDVDYVGITDEWSEEVTLARLEAISAVNQAGENVAVAITSSDKSYAELPMSGDFLDLYFEGPSDPGSNFILRGKGYYHHERHYTSRPNYKFLNAVRQDKMTTHQLSMLLRSQWELQANKTSNH